MLTEGAPGYTVAITTEGIKAALGMFVTDRNIQFGVLIYYLVSNVFFPIDLLIFIYMLSVELNYTPDASHHDLEMSS